MHENHLKASVWKSVQKSACYVLSQDWMYTIMKMNYKSLYQNRQKLPFWPDVWNASVSLKKIKCFYFDSFYTLLLNDEVKRFPTVVKTQALCNYESLNYTVATMEGYIHRGSQPRASDFSLFILIPNTVRLSTHWL